MAESGQVRPGQAADAAGRLTGAPAGPAVAGPQTDCWSGYRLSPARCPQEAATLSGAQQLRGLATATATEVAPEPWVRQAHQELAQGSILGTGIALAPTAEQHTWLGFCARVLTLVRAGQKLWRVALGLGFAGAASYTGYHFAYPSRAWPSSAACPRHGPWCWWHRAQRQGHQHGQLGRMHLALLPLPEQSMLSMARDPAWHQRCISSIWATMQLAHAWPAARWTTHAHAPGQLPAGPRTLMRQGRCCRSAASP